MAAQADPQEDVETSKASQALMQALDHDSDYEHLRSLDTVQNVDIRDPVAALQLNRPPQWSAPMYLALIERLLEVHRPGEVLPALCEVLQDVELAQLLGWDLMPKLLSISGSEEALHIIARLANPREIILGVNEHLSTLSLDLEEVGTEEASESVATDHFCLLLELSAIILPRIKTKHPSRFLSTSVMIINDCYRPTKQATLAVLRFVRAISGHKRPPLPGRQSSLDMVSIPHKMTVSPGPVASDQEAEGEEDPAEAAIQEKLIQAFVTHILEQYVNANPLQWAGRLLEFYHPDKVIPGRMSLNEAYREDPAFVVRDAIVGQLVALCRDVGLKSYQKLFDAIYVTNDAADETLSDPQENLPNSPEDIPLSAAGCLILVASNIFSFTVFDSKAPLPSLTIFPGHAKLVSKFWDCQEPGMPDILLTIGIWLEHSDKFVDGPLDDAEFTKYLQALSVLSASDPSPTIRYAAHVLTSSILHSHPKDRVRLSFITSIFEEDHDDPRLEGLKVSAVAWLKEEIITAEDRGTNNVFSTSTALIATLPHICPNLQEALSHEDAQIASQLMQNLSLHMSVLNFIFFLRSEQYIHLFPSEMMNRVQVSYLDTLRASQTRILAALDTGGLKDVMGDDVGKARVELELLGDRIELSSAER